MKHLTVLNYVRVCLLAVSLVGAGCSGCDEDELVSLPDPSIQRDVLAQKSSAKIDILWVIDNSESMRNEQRKLSNAFTTFFNTLVEAEVDYHMGVITTDSHEDGALRVYSGPDVEGCVGCSFLTSDVPCTSPREGNLGNIDEAELADDCAAQLVFKRLIQPGVDGYGFEESFRQSVRALGVISAEQEPQAPPDIPESNMGFIREDADLLIVYMSDEDESDKHDGLPVRYYERLLDRVKEQGNENRLLLAAVVGWDVDVPIQDICDDLAAVQNDTERRALLDDATGCLDNEELTRNPQSGTAVAESGRRYVDMVCRRGGALVNICDTDYSAGLERVGATLSSLRRKFVLSRGEELNWGDDGLPFTEDDCVLDCNEDGDFDDAVDAVICVKGVPFGTEDVLLVPHDDTAGFRYEQSTGSIIMDGAFLAAPGTELEVSYRVGDPANGCGAGRTD